MSPAGLPDRRVADRVASAGLSEEGLEEGLASVSRPSFDGSQARLLPAVVGGTGVPRIAPLEDNPQKMQTPATQSAIPLKCSPKIDTSTIATNEYRCNP